MDHEQIQGFTRRLSQCNRGEMIIIVYDILFTYLEDAGKALEENDRNSYKYALRKAQDTLSELIGALDFHYDLSKNLYSLYVFCRNELAKVMYEGKSDRLDTIEDILKHLYAGFKEAAKQDTSEPLMSNAQQVYAGMTYGKGQLTENYMEIDTHRGFFA